MNKDIVSIITTCYNCSRFVAYAIHSILSQKTNDDFSIEYIIVNDASTDNTLDVINNSINNYLNTEHTNNIEIKIYTLEENKGCGGARKFGISKATGNYFMFLDADDYYIYDEFVLRARQDIINYNADIIDYGMKLNLPSGEVVYNNVPNIVEITNDKTQQLVSLFKNNIIKFNVWSKIYTRAIVESYPYSDTRVYEDIRTVPVWIYNSTKIVAMPSIEINYRANNDSIIRKDNYETRLGTLTALYEMFMFFKDKEYDIQVLKAIYERAMIDFEFILDGHNSDDRYFNEASLLNTKMLAVLYPDDYQNLTYNIENNL